MRHMRFFLEKTRQTVTDVGAILEDSHAYVAVYFFC